MFRPAITALILIAGSIGYQPEEPPIVWFTVANRTFDDVPLLELRGDSIRVIDATWVRLEHITAFRHSSASRGTQGFFLGCLAGGLVGAGIAALADDGKRSSDLQFPAWWSGCACGSQIGAVGGCAVMKAKTHTFFALSQEERRHIIQDILSDGKTDQSQLTSQ